MKLQLFLEASKISPSLFCERIGVRPPTLSRYLAGRRIPNPEIMSAIYRETAGQVTPNDFYRLGEVAELAQLERAKRAAGEVA